MKDEEKISLECEDDPLSHPADGYDVPSFGLGERRGNRPEDKRAPETDTPERPAGETAGEMFDVNSDIRQFRHFRRE